MKKLTVPQAKALLPAVIRLWEKAGKAGVGRHPMLRRMRAAWEKYAAPVLKDDMIAEIKRGGKAVILAMTLAFSVSGCKMLPAVIDSIWPWATNALTSVESESTPTPQDTATPSVETPPDSTSFTNTDGTGPLVTNPVDGVVGPPGWNPADIPTWTVSGPSGGGDL